MNVTIESELINNILKKAETELFFYIAGKHPDYAKRTLKPVCHVIHVIDEKIKIDIQFSYLIGSEAKFSHTWVSAHLDPNSMIRLSLFHEYKRFKPKK